MQQYRKIALVSAFAVLLAPLGMLSAVVDSADQQQQASEPRQQAKERREAADQRQQAERSRDLQHRQEDERREDAERQREMEQRQDAERRQDAEHRRDTDQRQEAERRQDAERRRDGAARAMAPGQIRADELVGQKVISRQNDREVGKVTGFIMDEGGQIDAAIIEHGGFLGFFTSEVTVPWHQIELAADGKTMTTYLDRKQVRNARPYERN
jgi:hypothetical protein